MKNKPLFDSEKHLCDTGPKEHERLRTGLSRILPFFLAITVFCTACGSDFDLLLEKEKQSDSGVISDPGTDDPDAPDPDDPDPDDPDPDDPDPDDPDRPQVALIFWAQENNSLYSIPEDKHSDRKLLTQAGSQPYDIALNEAEDTIYWSVYEPTWSYIYSTSFAQSASPVQFYKSNKNIITALCITSQNPLLMWSQFKTANSTNGVFKSELTPAVPETIVSNLGTNYTNAAASDAEGSYLFLCVNDCYGRGLGSGSAGKIIVVDTAAAAFSTPLTYTASFSDAPVFTGIAAAPSGDTIYFVRNEGPLPAKDIIFKANSTISSPQQWLTASGFDIDKIAIDSTSAMLYFSSPETKRIYRVSLLDPSSPEIFLQLDSAPCAIGIAR